MCNYNHTFYNLPGVYDHSNYITLKVNKRLKYSEAKGLMLRAIEQFRSEMQHDPYPNSEYGVFRAEILQQPVFATYRRGLRFNYRKCKSNSFNRSHKHIKNPFLFFSQKWKIKTNT